jgi:hypothetical protein
MDADKMNESVHRISVPSSIRKITVLQKDSRGQVEPVVVFTRRARRKKVTPIFKPLETAVRRLSDAQARTAESYLARHRRSNRKRKDGWMVDLPSNAIRAGRKGAKALRLNRFFFF